MRTLFTVCLAVILSLGGIAAASARGASGHGAHGHSTHIGFHYGWGHHQKHTEAAQPSESAPKR